MCHARTAWLLALLLTAACAGSPDRHTLAGLREVEPDVTEMRIENGLDQAMHSYEKFLDETPESTLTPEAMRRLADLKLEKDFGILGDGELTELPVPETTTTEREAHADSPDRVRAVSVADSSESAEEFERRAASADVTIRPLEDFVPQHPGGEELEWAGPLEAIELYDEILAAYPAYPQNDQVLYQKARAYDELGRTEEAIAVMERLIGAYPHSKYIDEVQFRRAEYFFTRKRYVEAEEAYAAVSDMGASSEYYELALYKLGWTLYKQELHEEALHKYVELLDYKVSLGYDFDQSEDEDDERRIADTYRVISLSFSYLGGPEAVERYFAANGGRSYEDRIYSHLGEFYLGKLRYADAAAAYEAFVTLYPLHRVSPHFGMRVVEIYEEGSFPLLVLEAKKRFASRYGLESDYWHHFDVAESIEVLDYLKSNLKDLANHYHALYQQEDLVDDKPVNLAEAMGWYRQYLSSFPEDPETPDINYQLADLLLEHEDFGVAAREYERTAYDYPDHAKAAAAGYAAIYAHRKNQEAASESGGAAIRSDAVNSTLRFVDTFPRHEHAAVVLGAAVDDLYDMKEYEQAIVRGRALIESYPEADPSTRRSAWAAVAHSSFDVAEYAPAEDAYSQLLEMTSEDDKSHQAVVDNLAAAIYKQGEQANAAEDYRLAADHFLRIRQAAPSSEVRAAAEYDAGAALIRLEDWAGAAAVLESFRQTYPEHELSREATRNIAFVYREEGDISRAADEYERVATETDDPELRGESLLLAGELYEDSQAAERAVAVYRSYVDQFPKPLETAVETRFKIATLLESMHDEAGYHDQLAQIVEIDAAAGGERTDRIRYLAARSALVLAEGFYHRFIEVELVQPFEEHLKEKQRRMDAALAGFGRLVDYEVGEVTAAATFYMAEVYSDFSQALIESERPAGLGTAELQDYETVLEEEAFPFEERAIEVHEKNLELLAAGVYNAWVEKSLAQLADLMPGRYAKFEASSGFIASIDSYAYEAPRTQVEGVEKPAVDDGTTSDTPASQPDGDSAVEPAPANSAEAAAAG